MPSLIKKQKIIAALAIPFIIITGVLTISENKKVETAFDAKKYSLTDPTSIWVVVNKQHSIEPLSFVPHKLVPIGNHQELAAPAAQAYRQMVSDAQGQGLQLTPESGYRSYQQQQLVYDSEVQAYGQTTADLESARAGYSEHQTGLAIDFGSDGCRVQACFTNTPAGQWLLANSYRYGYILRYPAGKVIFTGYNAEPWHYRYVGRSLARELQKLDNPPLEQFFKVSGGKTYESPKKTK